MKCTSRGQAQEFYLDVIADAARQGCVMQTMRTLCLKDLYYLLSEVLTSSFLFRLPNLNQDWLYDRCREVYLEPYGCLDLWAREHFKSTIITYGRNIQEILLDAEITIGIFSHTRPIAKAFLVQIKNEFERNELLKDLFPDVLYRNPRRESPKWNENDGITVIRSTNPKESTVEAWGLVDGQPTSKHFRILNYDDVVTRESVTTPEQIKKITDAWELSLNLGSDGGHERYIGTRYHFNDTYKTMMDRGSVKKRVHPATDNGKVEGKPVLLTEAALAKKRRDMGPYTFGCQMLQDPKADKVQGFKEEWLQYWTPKKWAGMNRYIVVDAANEKKKTNDYTVMLVIGLSADLNYRLIDGFRSRLNLTERTRALFRLHKKYRPIAVGYEIYGMQSDDQYIREKMEEENYNFKLITLGGNMPKPDRIRRLIPFFENGRWFLPFRCPFIDNEDKEQDLTVQFVNDEYLAFPVASHDDILDAAARIVEKDLGAKFPNPEMALFGQVREPARAIMEDDVVDGRIVRRGAGGGNFARMED